MNCFPTSSIMYLLNMDDNLITYWSFSPGLCVQQENLVDHKEDFSLQVKESVQKNAMGCGKTYWKLFIQRNVTFKSTVFSTAKRLCIVDHSVTKDMSKFVEIKYYCICVLILKWYFGLHMCLSLKGNRNLVYSSCYTP